MREIKGISKIGSSGSFQLRRFVGVAIETCGVGVPRKWDRGVENKYLDPHDASEQW